MNRKGFSLLIFLLAGVLVCQGQDTSFVPSDTSGAATDMEHMQFSNPDSTIQNLYQQIQKISENDRQNAQAIQALLQGKEIDNLTKYQILKNNIINASQTYYLLNKKIIDLKSRTTSNDLDVFIASLNNPESKELGFSFSERVVDLVKSVVLEGKAYRNNRNQQILQSTNSIINSPLFKSFTSLTPPLGIADAIMTFLHSVAINNRKAINAKNLKIFETELDKYVVYYTSLNEGNQKFEYGLNFNKDQLKTLHEDLYNHLLFTSQALKFPLPVRKDNIPLSSVLNKYFLTFTKDKIEDYFTNLEKKYTNPTTQKIDYERLLRENPNLKEVNNQLEDLVLQTKRFSTIYNEYFTLLNNYYSQVISSLQIAADNGLAEKTLVQQKQEEFRKLKQEAVTDIKASINIDELKENTDNIKYRFKIY